MKKSISIAFLLVIVFALLYGAPQRSCLGQSYSIRPTCAPTAPCRPNTLTFGYNDTNWRQWPIQPRPEEKNPLSVGAQVIPPPPPIVEKPLPRAENVPAKPPISGGDILPGLTPGPLSSPGPNGSNGGATNGPSGASPNPGSGRNVEGLPGIGEGIDRGPAHPETGRPETGRPSNAPKSDAGGGNLLPPQDTVLPGGLVPEILSAPAVPIMTPKKSPESGKPAPSMSNPPTDLDAKPLKPDAPPPTSGSSLPKRQKELVAQRATTPKAGLPMQANWDAALEPDVVGNNQLRNTRFEQIVPAKRNPLRSSMEGYCPVQLQDHNLWVAGKPELQMSYQGQVFHFSDEAALKRFEASPERYAPVHGGNDVVLAMEENRVMPGSVNHSAMWHGQLFLFSSSTTLAAFQDDPRRYAAPKPQVPPQSAVESGPNGF